MTAQERRQQIVELAQEIVASREEGSESLRTLLPKCHRLCKLAEDEELALWTDLERKGLIDENDRRKLESGNDVQKAARERFRRTRTTTEPTSGASYEHWLSAQALESHAHELRSKTDDKSRKGLVSVTMAIEQIKDEVHRVACDILRSYKFGSVAQEILNQAREIIELSESRRASVPDLLRKCHHLGRLSRRQDIALWALCEQDGIDPGHVLPIEAYDDEDRRLAYDRFARTRTVGEPKDKKGIFRASINELIHSSQVNNMEASEVGAYEMVFDEDIVLERIGNEIHAVACDILSTYEHRYEVEAAVKQEEDRLTDQERARLPEKMLPEEFSVRSESDRKGKGIQWAYVLTCVLALACATMAVVAFITQKPVAGGVLSLLLLALVAITWPWLKHMRLGRTEIAFKDGVPRREEDKTETGSRP